MHLDKVSLWDKSITCNKSHILLIEFLYHCTYLFIRIDNFIQFQLELEAVQKVKSAKRLMSTIGRQSIKPGQSDKPNTKTGAQQQSSFDEDKSKDR